MANRNPGAPAHPETSAPRNPLTSSEFTSRVVFGALADLETARQELRDTRAEIADVRESFADLRSEVKGIRDDLNAVTEMLHAVLGGRA